VRRRCGGSVSSRQTGRYCFITHSRSVVAVAAARVLDPLGIPPRDVDTALFKDPARRNVTRTVASWLYDLRDAHRQPLVDGVTFRSRLGDDLRMWAIFERPTGDRSPHIHPAAHHAVTPELPALVEAMRRHGLTWRT
jgi:hypothetical protein